MSKQNKKSNEPIFVGYIITNHQEEFLHKFEIKDKFFIRRAWTITPELAYIFDSFDIAMNIIKQLEMEHSAYVLELFETETQLIPCFNFDLGQDNPFEK